MRKKAFSSIFPHSRMNNKYIFYKTSSEHCRSQTSSARTGCRRSHLRPTCRCLRWPNGGGGLPRELTFVKPRKRNGVKWWSVKVAALGHQTWWGYGVGGEVFSLSSMKVSMSPSSLLPRSLSLFVCQFRAMALLNERGREGGVPKQMRIMRVVGADCSDQRYIWRITHRRRQNTSKTCLSNIIKYEK